MNKKEITRRSYHLSFFEKEVNDLGNDFIKNIIKKLYQEYILIKNYGINYNYKIDSLISVIMPVYNNQDTLEYAIDSILNQTYTNWELILVDDGSIDKSKNIIEKYLKDSRIKYIYQKNIGVAGARNTGINHSSGDFIKLCDSDDILMPYALDLLIRSLPFCDDKTGIFYDDMVSKYENTYEISIMDPPLKGNDLYIQQLKGNIFPVGSVLIRKSVFEKVGYFDTTINGIDDFDMWNRIIQHFNVYKINIAPIYIQVMHDNQQSKDIQTLKCFTDISINKFLNNIGINNIYPQNNNADESLKRITKYDLLIKNMLKRVDTPYDSVFKIMDYLQSLNYNKERSDLFIKSIHENNNNFVSSYLKFLNLPKKSFDNIEDLYNYFNFCITQRFKLNKIYCSDNNNIISCFHEYNSFYIEYINKSKSYYILYSNWRYERLPFKIVEFINNNIDQIWVNDNYIKQKHINSGILEDKIKVLNTFDESVYEDNLYYISDSDIFSFDTLNIKNIESYKTKFIYENDYFKKDIVLKFLNDLFINSSRTKNYKEVYINELDKCLENQYYRKVILLLELIKLKNNIDYIAELTENLIKIGHYRYCINLASDFLKKGYKNKKILLNMSICLKNIGDIKTANILYNKAESL